ncbi:hypothetical protein V6N12_023980 [Hibiscus sabdariffa]|uniref:Phorbol-ester/DAG-type domain-containing protein n=1 Tax=Hibiscus sabdariffa TaxID=183260 RepID=A0ABR2FZ79_9ROSI
MEIKLASHEHSMDHHYFHDTDDKWCDKCSKKISGAAYACLSCELWLHESCAKALQHLPREITHPLHSQHRLVLDWSGTTRDFTCDICLKISTGTNYGCCRCDFELDLVCAFASFDHQAMKMKQRSNAAMDRQIIQHYCHAHPMVLNNYNNVGEHGYNCSWCDKPLTGIFYGCKGCGFFLHQFCLNKVTRRAIVAESAISTLIFTVQNSFPPLNMSATTIVSLILVSASGIRFSNIISNASLAMSFVPAETSTPLSMDGKALELNGMEQSEMTLVRPFIHEHPLKFCEEMRELEQQYCNGCRLELSGPGYICEGCPHFFRGYRLHESCAKLPNQIQHPLHPTHHLNLYARSPYMLDYIICDGCDDFSLGFIYLCEKCDFKLDLKCATRTRTTTPSGSSRSKESERETELFHFSHKHKLIFCNFNDPRYQRRCNFCRLQIFGPTYNCITCAWILHESCLKLPQETRVPIHSQHVSILSYMRYGRCHACGLKLLPAGYNYGCKDCHLNFHIACAGSLSGAMKRESHVHHLHYFGTEFHRFFAMYTDLIDLYAGLSCSHCGGVCSVGSFYRCLECDINFHLECVPLPQIVKSKSHVHPLTLKDSFIEDDSGEYYCDACEEPRHPGDHVYFCEECKGIFVAHIECALSKEEKVDVYMVPRERKTRMRKPRLTWRA